MSSQGCNQMKCHKPKAAYDSNASIKSWHIRNIACMGVSLRKQLLILQKFSHSRINHASSANNILLLPSNHQIHFFNCFLKWYTKLLAADSTFCWSPTCSQACAPQLPPFANDLHGLPMVLPIFSSRTHRKDSTKHRLKQRLWEEANQTQRMEAWS